MRKFLMLILCLFLASTLVVSVSCKKKEEAPPAPVEEIAPPAEVPPAPPMEVAPAEEEPFEPTEEAAPAEEEPPLEEHY